MLETNDKQYAQTIMRELGETEHNVQGQLYRSIEVLGLEVVQAVLAETRETEANGGLLRKDGERRTLGGVFFALLKTHTTREQYKRIFWPAPRKPAPAASDAPPPQPVAPPPSDQAQQIAGVILEKLKISAKKQVTVAREVERAGIAAALAALRATQKVEQQGGRMDAEGTRIKPLELWRTALDVASKAEA
ncbi:MAG: hypothetical protein H0X37_16575 [Herpetosiphonaceae bacterium]|nr:hypothetical protein [Herpetosiphonaceae bacterium]